MARKMMLLLATALCLSLVAAPGWAAVDNTSHDTQIGQQGVCSACHIPHKSTGKRLWPSNMASQETAFGEVGALCYYCHGSGGGGGISNAVQSLIMTSGAGSQGEYSHGLNMNNIPAGDNLANASTAGLPYTDTAVSTNMQCASCHDVHNDPANLRPFLRANIDVLCAYCHASRMYVGGAAYTLGNAYGAWGAFYGAANPGSHPVGSDVDTDADANSPISIGAAFNVAKNAAVAGPLGSWSLGGHEGAGGTVTCATCHAVHGQRIDPGGAGSEAGGTYPVFRLLVVDQTSADGANADGDGTAKNGECEGCHLTGGATYGGDLVLYSSYGTDRPNPGATTYTHPVDTLHAGGDAGVANGTDFTNASWPVGSTPGTNMSPAVICESCHAAHPGVNQGLANSPQRSDANYVIDGVGNHILRDDEDTLCGRCHVAANFGHHPTGNGLLSADFDASGVSGGVIGNGDANLDCGDCHGDQGAHNWGSAGVGLDTNWVPANNARGAADVIGQINAQMSATCERCHTDGATRSSPTRFVANADASQAGTTNAGGLGVRVRGSYQDSGDASHMLGAVTGGTGWYAGGTINVFTTAWPAGGWSRFGTAGAMACESCHELEGSKNTALSFSTPMLLGDYVEGDATDPSSFCENCHGATPGGGTPHPMTGDNITKEQLISGAAANLVTSGRWSYALATGTIARAGTTVTIPAADAQNCDSCHQPHDAPTNGGTYIYEGLSTSVGAGGEDIAFCQQCHNM